MALDHTRDYVHAAAMAFAPEDLSWATPAIFRSRLPVVRTPAGAAADVVAQLPAGSSPRRTAPRLPGVPLTSNPDDVVRGVRRFAGAFLQVSASIITSITVPRRTNALSSFLLFLLLSLVVAEFEPRCQPLFACRDSRVVIVSLSRPASSVLIVSSVLDTTCRLVIEMTLAPDIDAVKVTSVTGFRWTP